MDGHMGITNQHAVSAERVQVLNVFNSLMQKDNHGDSCLLVNHISEVRNTLEDSLTNVKRGREQSIWFDHCKQPNQVIPVNILLWFESPI